MIRRVLLAVDPVAVEAALTAWALAPPQRPGSHCRAGVATGERATVGAGGGRQTLPGARGPDGQQTKLVSVIDSAHQLVLTQTEVIDGNEIAAFVTALDTLPALRGQVVTADVLHTQ